MIPCSLLRINRINFLFLALIFFVGWVGLGGITSCSEVPEETLIVESTPHGAKGYIGEQFVGSTPLAITRTKNHVGKNIKLNLVLEGFHEYQTTLSASNYYQVTLLPYERELTISFAPAPNIVYIDNKSITNGISKKNTLSITLSLPLGNHEIFAYLENYPFLEHVINLSPQSPREIKLPLSTEKFQNALSITGVPDKIAVYYQGKLLGSAPLTLKNLQPSPFSLEFKKPGYENKEVVFNLAKKEYRPVIARLNQLKNKFKVAFTPVVANSKITIDEELMIGETNPVAITELTGKNETFQQMAVGVQYKEELYRNTSRGVYRYRIIHPGYYPVTGEFPMLPALGKDDAGNDKVITSDAEIKLVINTEQVPRIPTTPKLIIKKPLPDFVKNINAESDYHKVQLDKTGENFFVSAPVSEELRVYDRSFNELRRYEFGKVGVRDIPRLTIGFDYRDYSSPLRLLVGNRVVGQDMVYSFNGAEVKEPIITPAYLIPLTLGDVTTATPGYIALFDNGYHALRIYALNKPPTLVKQVQAINYFQLHKENPRSANMLPLRFQQAIFLPPQTNSIFTDETQNKTNATYNFARLVFTDIVNRDIKEYRFNPELFTTGFKELNNNQTEFELGYFISRYNEQPNDPGAITLYRGLVLIATRSTPTKPVVWVYDQAGNFIHSLNLNASIDSLTKSEQVKEIRYLYTLGNTLYVFTNEEVELYALVP